MRQSTGTSVSELKRKHNHLVPSNERVLALTDSEKTMSLTEVGIARGVAHEDSDWPWPHAVVANVQPQIGCTAAASESTGR